MSQQSNYWQNKQVNINANQKQNKKSNKNKQETKTANNAEISNSNSLQRFEAEHSRNIAAAKKIIDNYISSSEDEEELDENVILTTLYQHYTPTADNSEREQLLHKTANILENVLNSGAATCLICIGSVKRTDAIWSCRHCYCCFHLNCIKRWANDSVAQLKAQADKQQNEQQGYYNHLGEYIAKKIRRLVWCCPQCREEYEPEERPTDYLCFCGKELNPRSQQWLVPHSCGEICGKLLKPACGHKCMLLCHPGPCPPCSQYAKTSCLCGKSAVKSVRCSDKKWQCLEQCKKLLPCGEHKCNQICHTADKCPPCKHSSKYPCRCSREVQKRNCAESDWSCQKICGKKLTCDLHTCKRICHVGDCGVCPLSLPRTCPCGKTKKQLPCNEIIDSCGDTCQKLLECGQHHCAQRCHRGDCNLCLIITKKKCRCGCHQKELPCWKEFTCETKCKQMRDCGKHVCNKKCCDGNCPPCDKICLKPLSCKKHKCQSVCHDGPCYPCKLQTQINCRCGKTSKLVPCGHERKARIVCMELCRIPSKCHHETKHRCHKNECPHCNQKCGLPNDTTGCAHPCEAKCHAAIRVMTNSNENWPQNRKPKYISTPHPRCEQKVLTSCIGGHEVVYWPCWNSKPSSCQRKCQRILKCGNHRCELVCHEVPDKENLNEQLGCAKCENGCTVPRTNGCIHPCPSPCHQPPCPPCNANTKSKCHCGLVTQLIYKCIEFYDPNGSREDIAIRQEKLKSCGSRCMKNFPCGHRCKAICHSGACPNPELCRKKLRIQCECKRLKLEISCDKYRTGFTSLPCDENCEQTRSLMEAQQQIAAEKLRLEEEAKNRFELEQFEKKFSTKRKPRERKIAVEQVKRKIDWMRIGIYLGVVAVVLIAILVALYEGQ